MIRPAYLAVLLSTVVLAQQTRQPAPSSEPMSTERIRIYLDFLQNHYDNGRNGTLNVAESTVAFLSLPTHCLSQFKPEELWSSSTHTFPVDAFTGMAIRLVDARTIRGRSNENPTSGVKVPIFTFSDIVFDRSHRHAAFRYYFDCGNVCGHNGTVVYELQKKNWTWASESCVAYAELVRPRQAIIAR